MTGADRFKGEVSVGKKTFNYEITLPSEKHGVATSFEELKNKYIVDIINDGKHLSLETFEEYIVFFKLLMTQCANFRDKKLELVPFEDDIDLNTDEVNILTTKKFGCRFAA